MLTRWLSALVGIPVFLGLVIWGREPFAVAVFLAAIAGFWELSTAWRKAEIHANHLVLSLGLLLPLYAWVNWLDASPQLHWARSSRLDAVLSIGGVVLLIAAVAEVFRAARTGEMLVARHLGYGLLGACYLSLFSGLAWLRADTAAVGVGVFPRIDAGVGHLLLAAFCVWATDSFALFTGKAFGKRKLAPFLSPGKTWEGAVGGLAAALVVGGVCGSLLLGQPYVGILVGTVAGTLGQIGDLFKSSLKREAGIKDFGSILPGHGGVLDRFDSLLFVAPVVCLLLTALQ